MSVTLFTAEHRRRRWSCASDPKYAHPLWGRMRQALRLMTMMDLLAIAPTYLILATGGGGLDFRSLRL